MRDNDLGGENKQENKIKKREGFFELMARLNKERDKLPEGEKLKLEKKDWIALFASAFFTLFLPAVAVILIMSFAALALFGYFG